MIYLKNKIDKLPFEITIKGTIGMPEWDLLFHTVDDKGNQYILSWIDSPEKSRERHILYQVTKEDLVEFLKGNVGEWTLVSKQESVYFIDWVHGDPEYNAVYLYKVSDIPEDCALATKPYTERDWEPYAKTLLNELNNHKSQDE